MGAMLAQVIFTLVACLVMEKAGRRVFLFLSLALCAFSNFAIALYFWAKTHGHNPPAMMALSSIGVYIVGFSFGLGPIPWLMLAELFTTEVRGVASSIAIATNWACSFFITLTFDPMLKIMGHAGTFFMFGAIVTLGIGFTSCLVPETRGKNIDEVLAAMNGGDALEPSPRDGLLATPSVRSLGPSSSVHS